MVVVGFFPEPAAGGLAPGPPPAGPAVAGLALARPAVARRGLAWPILAQPAFAQPALARPILARPILARRCSTACHARTSRVLTLEFTHEGDQRLDARERHGIVDARAHTAQHPGFLQNMQGGPRRLGKRSSIHIWR